MKKEKKKSWQHPLVWMAAGAGLTFIIIAAVALVLVPKWSDDSPAVETATAPLPATTAELAAETPIPTFTPSRTPTPSLTPTASLTPTPSETPTATPTETPTLTPSVTPTPPPVVRANQDVRLFAGPDTDYSEQGWLVKDQQALILSQLEGGQWWYVQTELGIKGWVQAAAVTAENDLATVPVVTPYPLGPTVPQPVPAGDTPTPAPVIGPLLFDEVWPVSADCTGGFSFNLWLRAHGGTGIYTYLVNDQIVAENVVDGGTTVAVTGVGNWQGTVSVISGDLRADSQVLFKASDWCKD